jgi:hypothetical protein
VVKAPGRRFPGVVVQGDTLRSLAGLATEIVERVGDTEDEELRDGLLDLREQLGGLLSHYEAVLKEHGHPLPY